MGSALWLQKSTSHHPDPNIFYSHLNLKDKKYKEIVQSNLNSSAIKHLINGKIGETTYSDINYYILARLIESLFLKGNPGIIALIS